MNDVKVKMWRYYFPDDGEDGVDAHVLHTDRKLDAEDAAQLACESDFKRHDGWERGEEEFIIVVVSPDGEHHRFKAWHEQTVDHRVEADD